MRRRDPSDRSLEAPPDAIALDRLAHRPGDGEPEARPLRRCGGLLLARLGLQHKRRHAPSPTLAHPLELRAPLQGSHAPGGASYSPLLCLGHGPPIRCPMRSRREALAALGAPPRHHPAAAGGRHTLAEPMAALAHEPAWLIGPFHVASPLCPSGIRQINKAGCRVSPARVRIRFSSGTDWKSPRL